MRISPISDLPRSLMVLVSAFVHQFFLVDSQRNVASAIIGTFLIKDEIVSIDLL